jgi:iron(III) transport system substrate-binding protein
MKAFVKVLTLVVIVSLAVGCGGTPATTVAVATQPPATKAPPTQVPPPTAVPLTAAEQWAKDNGLGPYQPATLDWAAIEASANKEGSVCVYANSSKISKLLAPWAALYPNIKLDCGDTDDISTKMAGEQQGGNVVGDVWFNSDGHILYGEFVPNEWIWSFVPDGYADPEVTAEQPIAIARHSVDVLGYNSEINPNGCPLTNWWQITEPALSGKIYMEDPIADVSTMAKMATFVQDADIMATAYKDLYGVDWTTDPAAQVDQYGTKPENAGYLFLKKLAQNKPGIMPGGDEVDAAYATLGMDPTVEPGYGITGWDSVNTTADGEIAMGACLTLDPSIGLVKTNYLAIANNAPHPNAAKLFIKFVLTTTDGFKPWFVIGTYPGNTNVAAPEGMPPLASLVGKAFFMDPVFDWANVSKVRDFWAISLLAP